MTESASYSGSAASTALRIAIGDTEITVAGGESAATFARSQVEILKLRVDRGLVASCGPDAASIPGSDECVGRAALRAANFEQAGAESILADDLVAAGLASYATDSTSVTLSGQDATAVSKGLVLPGFALGEAACSGAKLAEEVVAIATPEQLEPAIVASIGSASCRVSVRNLPSANHTSGEIAIDLTLTREIVKSAPQLRSALEDIQEEIAQLPAQISEPVNTAIDSIVDELDSHPLVSIRIAPNRGEVDGRDAGITSEAPGTAVRITVLGGLLELEIGVARTAASVLASQPAATADVSFVKVKALNITTSDPSDAVIEHEFEAPADISVLDDTPLALNVVTSRGTTSTTCPADSGFTTCAAATGDALSIRALGDPLPALSIQLAHSQTQAAGVVTKVAAAPVLPATGPWAVPTVLGGVALAGAALLARRRLAR